MCCLKTLIFKTLCKCFFCLKSRSRSDDEILNSLNSINFVNLNQLEFDDGISNTLHFCGSDECMICLEELNHDECIFIKCCQCVMHKKCFVLWCNKEKSMNCPLCHTCLSV